MSNLTFFRNFVKFGEPPKTGRHPENHFLEILGPIELLFGLEVVQKWVILTHFRVQNDPFSDGLIAKVTFLVFCQKMGQNGKKWQKMGRPF